MQQRLRHGVKISKKRWEDARANKHAGSAGIAPNAVGWVEKGREARRMRRVLQCARMIACLAEPKEATQPRTWPF